MKLVYIAGPFRAPNAWEVEQNVRQAETLALAVWRSGFAVICPHCNTRFFSGAASDEVWLEGDLEMLSRCDALLTTSDWAGSSGARAEVTFAEARKIPVFHTLLQLNWWGDEEPKSRKRR